MSETKDSGQRSTSPRSRAGPKHVRDVDPKRAVERERQMEERRRENLNKDQEEKPELDPVAEYSRLMGLRSGGTYVPPARLRALQAQMNVSKNSKEYQRMRWEELKKAINGLINKASTDNIKDIIKTIFSHNLVRGRGLFCRSIMKAQSVSLPYTPIYAAMVAVINSKLPEVGELLVKRLLIQFRRAYKRNDKPVCLSSSIFLGHLGNYQVAHEIISLQMLYLLLAQPTDDSVEIAVGFARVVGANLFENSPSAASGVFERFRTILVEARLEKRTQYMVEVLFKVRKDGFEHNPAIQADLDLVDEEDQITHMIGLDDELKSEDMLNIFRFDDNYEENETKYKELQKEILGEEEESESESGSESESEEEEPEETVVIKDGKMDDHKIVIKDMTQTELMNLRRTVYLTIMSTMSTQEIVHKLFKIHVPQGNDIEVVNMIVECCAQEKTYNKIYGGVGVLACNSRGSWQRLFRSSFEHYYGIIHRYETNKLRNIATMFGYMMAKDALGWEVLEHVVMTEEDSTAASRIFVKILLEEMRQELGIKKLVERFKEPYIQPYLKNLLVRDRTAADTRFSINYFTAIGLGVLTEDLREYLKELPPDRGRSTSRSSFSSRSRSDSDSYSGSNYSGSSRSRSRSRSYYRSWSRSRSMSLSRSPRKGRASSYSRSRERSSSYSPPSRRRYPQRGARACSHSRSPPRGRRLSYSRSPPRGQQPSYSLSPSQSPPRGRRLDYSRSPRRRSYSGSRSPRRSPPAKSKPYSYPPPRDGAQNGSRFARSPTPERGRRRRPMQTRDARSRSMTASPPPKRPKNWQEVEQRVERNGPRGKRAQAADFI